MNVTLNILICLLILAGVVISCISIFRKEKSCGQCDGCPMSGSCRKRTDEPE